jgi:hypothetical protein
VTITAESFAGRVLAVFSRRSPGFRPPLNTSGLRVPDSPATPPPAPVPDVPSPRDTPQASATQDVVTGPSLADVTARWKSASAQQRLQRRGDLLAVAEFLRTAVSARALALELDRGLARHIDLARARDLARHLARDLPRALDHDLARALDHDLASARGLARHLARALDHANDRARDRARIGDIDLARDIELLRYIDMALDIARHLARDRASDVDVIEAHDNLTDAANNFLGADLTTVQLDEVNLAGICWDSYTRWPTSEWAARMRSASVEDPPGSGVFVVLPVDGHHDTDIGSLAPIS